MPEFAENDAMHRIQSVCAAIQSTIPEGYRFMVFLLPEQGAANARAHYAGNIDRPTALESMVEWLERNGKAQDWMKHLDGGELPRGFQGFQSEPDAQVQAICDLALSALDHEWMPIETAPKDGTRYLVSNARLTTTNKQIAVAWFDDGYELEGHEGEWITYGKFVVCPTHYMPLPEPPRETL